MVCFPSVTLNIHAFEFEEEPHNFYFKPLPTINLSQSQVNNLYTFEMEL